MRLDIQQEQRTVYTWRCHCGKKLSSLFRDQLESNAKSHLKSHEGKAVPA